MLSQSRDTFSAIPAIPQQGAIPPFGALFTYTYQCDSPICNISRDTCAIPRKTSTKQFCDTIAESIARYERRGSFYLQLELFFQARLLYGWRTFLVQNGYSEPRWDLSVLQSASQSVVHNITSALTSLQGTLTKLDSSCLSLWAHNLLQGSVNIDGIRT